MIFLQTYPSTIQLFNYSTIQLLNNSTIQQFNNSTIQQNNKTTKQQQQQQQQQHPSCKLVSKPHELSLYPPVVNISINYKHPQPWIGI